MNNNYWQKQTATPLYSDLDFGKPEQKSLAGTLTIIGGHSGSFRTIAAAATIAEQLGVGTLHILLPDSLKKTIPVGTPNLTFAPAEPSGGFGRAAEPVLRTATTESDATLILGDLGRNAETATTISSLVQTTTQPLVITRDAIDLITTETQTWIDRPSLTLLLTLPQLQKLFRHLYYPRVITLSQPLSQLIETLHKATITYPDLTLATTHNGSYIVAHTGQVTTTNLSDTTYTPLSLATTPDLATTITIHQIRQPHYPPAATTTAILAK